MKIKNLVPALVLSAVAVPATSMAETTANIGWVSEYLYRGVFQEDSSASAGVDYTHDSGFYLGTWGADVGLGLETDLYFGFAGGDEFTYKIGYTGYYYTDDFDDTYNEINLGIGYGITSEHTPLSPNPRTCFWGGWGGSLIVNDLDARTTIAYVMNRMGEGTVGDDRGLAILLGTYASLT